LFVLLKHNCSNWNHWWNLKLLKIFLSIYIFFFFWIFRILYQAPVWYATVFGIKLYKLKPLEFTFSSQLYFYTFLLVWWKLINVSSLKDIPNILFIIEVWKYLKKIIKTLSITFFCPIFKQFEWRRIWESTVFFCILLLCCMNS
jgi:hypothetical protein